MRVLPYQQQLLVELDRLLRLPFRGVPEHHNDWRQRSESHHRRLPDYRLAMRFLPPDYNLGCGSF
jgi:hypothetical protein